MADIDPTLLAAETKVAAPGPPLMHKAANVMGDWAARAAGTGLAATVLLPWRIEPQSWPQIWHELWQMQHAVWQRQAQLQDNWLQNWIAWSNAFTEVRGANTMTKLVARELDLVAQWQELVSNQTTDVVSLLENLEINYAYWVNEKLR
jgi:hypothetical protein